MKITFKFIPSLALTVATCSAPGSADDGQEATRRAIVRSAADQVVVPAYQAAAERLLVLANATATLADDAAADPATADPSAARAAFADAMDAWQRVEILRFGPAGPAGLVTGGESLRDEIYSWPTTNPCRIDEELTEGSFDDPNFFTANLVNVRGLDAVAYLLFVETPGNACDATRPINKDGAWEALGSDEIARRRLRYAALAAADAADRAAALAARWAPDGGDAYAGFVAAGSEGSPYPTTRVALDEFAVGLFDLEAEVKERKLAVTDPEALEGRYGGRSEAYVLANLDAARAVFYGAPTPEAGTGFDDWLRNLGQAGLVADVEAAFAAADAAVRAIGPFDEALARDGAALAPAADAVGELTALLKGPVLAALSLMPPADGAGDAD